jgi:urocanate hydratase
MSHPIQPSFLETVKEIKEAVQLADFQLDIQKGIPDTLPEYPPIEGSVSRAPKRNREGALSDEEKVLAIQNALRYFPPHLHSTLAQEFADELKAYGWIYMHRFRPHYAMQARQIETYPAKSKQAAAIMLMIQNNLDPSVAKHPYELITYGGNGAVFHNWAQYRLTMQYLSKMTNNQTLVLYAGHPLGLFPSTENAPRVVVTNGMMIPSYSKKEDWNRYNAFEVALYGQLMAEAADSNIESMLLGDITNGSAWSLYEGSIHTIKRAMKQNPDLTVTLPNIVDSDILRGIKW